MITRIIEWSLDNRFLVLIASILLAIFGSYALKHTPVDAIPDLSDVQVIVKTSYPGQAPQVVEDQVTYPLATAMLGVPGAVTVRGYSFFGDSFVYVIFKDGTDLYWARSRVLEYLNQVASQLPDGAKPELGPDATGVGWIYEYALADSSGQHSLAALTTLQNWQIKYALQTVPGVSEVATVGGMVKQYQVVLDPNLLRTYGLTLPQVKQAIKAANSEAGGSVVEMAEAEYMVRTNGYIRSIADLNAIPLGVSHQGTPILLKDVATIRLGPQLRRGVAELDGKGEVVGGIVVMRSGENALETIKAVKAKLKEIQKSLPDGVKIVETYDRSGLITRAIDNLQSKLLEESLIVILVCFLFLFHFRSSLVVLVTLPMGVLVAFLIMYLQGINANIMSLGGIAIAIGAMTDAAIVMIENVHKHFARHEVTDQSRWKIIRSATIEVGPALFTSLLIITLSFLPIFSLQAQEGRLFTPLAFTKTYAMAASAGLSITLVPVLIGLFIRGKTMAEQENPINRLLISAYSPMVNAVLRYPKVIVVITLLIIVSAVLPATFIGSEFMPTLDEGDWMYMPTTLPGISIGKARQLLQQTDKLIKSVPEVKSVFGKIGRANTATDPAPLTMIESVVQLKPKHEWRSGMTRAKLKSIFNDLINFPGLTNAWVMPIKTRIDMLATGIKTPVGIKITGPSLTEIQRIGGEIEKILKSLKGTASVYADRAVGGRYLQINIDREQAARFGLNIHHIQEVVRTAIGGMNVTQTIEGRERFPINLRYPQALRSSLEKIRFLPIVTPTGAHIPLEEVANITITGGPPVIKSEDAKLTGWVLVDIDNVDIGTYIQSAKKLLETKLKRLPGYQLAWSGQYEYMQRAKSRLEKVIPVTLIIIILLLYLNFQSAGEILIILLTLPLSLVGSVWTIYLLHYNWSIAVAVGMIALAGVAIEIGVIMLVYLNQAIEMNPVITRHDLKLAVIQGTLLRVRPIIMTVATIILGLLPIMFGSGAGSEIMKRIAAPMFGGMISATILTLFLLPAVYYLWKGRGMKKE